MFKESVICIIIVAVIFSLDMFTQDYTNKTTLEITKIFSDLKEQILKNMFSNAAMYFIYGAAGTGKTTLVNHVTSLLDGKEKLYLAKTNPAVDNLRRKISNKDGKCVFSTID